MMGRQGLGGGSYHCALQILAILFKLNLFILPGRPIQTFTLALCIKRVVLLCQELNAGQKFLGMSVTE
jgi:hypothetical protein